MPAQDSPDRSLGEIGRTLDAFRQEMRDRNDKIDHKLDLMSQTYVSRESFNLVTDSIREDITRVDKNHTALCTDVEAKHSKVLTDLASDRKDRVTSTRWAIGIGLTALGLMLSSVIGVMTLIVPHLVTK